MINLQTIVIPLSISVSLVVGLAACGAEPEPTAPPASPPAPPPGPPAKVAPKQYSGPPPMTIDANKSYTATVEMEKGGSFVVELYHKEAPNTVNSFVFLARDGFYDGVTFHRVIPGFMAQGGDPTGTGSGGPGYRFDNEFHPTRRHDAPGIMSMANSGVRNGRGTNGSQFFLMFVPDSRLDGLNADGSSKDCNQAGVSCHSVFGKVIQGIAVVNAITPRNPAAATALGDTIKTITIQEQ